jgi:outer membrane protein OmpA-like peptidoglycan-associated protein
VALVATLAGAILGSLLTLVGLSLPAVQGRVFGGRLALVPAASRAPERAEPTGAAASPDLRSPPAAAAQAALGEPPSSAPEAQAPAPPPPATPAPAPPAPALPGVAAAPEGVATEAPGLELPNAPGEEAVLPVAFVSGSTRVAAADVDAFRELARQIGEQRTLRFELVGYASEGETADLDAAVRLAARRADKALDMIRSFGPSGHRFETRGAAADEPLPAAARRADGSGAVVLRPSSR